VSTARKLAGHLLGPMTPGAKRAVVMLFVLSLALSAANLLFANAQARRQDATIAQLRAQEAQLRSQQLAGCAFAADLGGVPIPGKPRPSRLGVSLVTDSRMQWRALHCPGTLPMPPGLAHWAAVYHLPAS
jgi:hypothetical protein